MNLSIYRTQPWLIIPSIYKDLMAKLETIFDKEKKEKKDNYTTNSEIAEMSLSGIFVKGIDLPEYGFLDTNSIGENIDKISEDDTIKGLLLHIDSPGGGVTGIPELATKIKTLNERKPVIVYSDSLIASAGYWVASQADAIVITKSAEIGSIGVYSSFLDTQRMYENMGVKRELFKNEDGTYKGIMDGISLTEEQKKKYQDDVDEVFSWFKEAVLSNRNVKEEAMKGQTYFGENSIGVGLADIIGDKEQAKKELVGAIELRRK